MSELRFIKSFDLSSDGFWLSLSGDQKGTLQMMMWMASWEEKEHFCHKCGVAEVLPPRSFISSNREIAHKIRVGHASVDRLIKKLKSEAHLEARLGHCHGSYTFLNTRFFDNNKLECGTVRGTGEALTIYKELKNIRTKEHKNIPPQFLLLADSLRDSILRFKPNHRLGTTYTDATRNS